MMSGPTGDDFREAHQVFHRDGERLERELIASLASMPVRRESTTTRRSLFGRPAYRSVRVWISGALAVSLAAVVWLMQANVVPQQVFGIDGLRQRMLQCRSVWVKGRQFVPPPGAAEGEFEERPFEWYAERPRSYALAMRRRGTSIDSGTYRAGDGVRYLQVDFENHSATTGKESAFAAEIQTEHIFQRRVVVGILGRSRGRHLPIGVEQRNGVETDVFESMSSFFGGSRHRQVVWLDRTSGFPVAAAIYLQDTSGQEHPLMMMDEIIVDVPRDPDNVSLKPPDGLQVDEVDLPPGDLGAASPGSAEDEDFELRFAFRLAGDGILVFWTYRNQAEQPPAADPLQSEENGLTVRSIDGPNRLFEHHLMRSGLRQGRTWYWSLFLAEDGHPVGDANRFKFQIKTKFGTSSTTTTPLVFERYRLADLLVQAQSNLIEDDPRYRPVTLDEILEFIERRPNSL